MHWFCTGRLVIDFTPNFFDLIAKGKIKLEVTFDFINTMHDGTVVFDANFSGDFGGTEAKFFLEEKHCDLAGVFDVGDARFAFELIRSETIVFGDFVDNTLG